MHDIIFYTHRFCLYIISFTLPRKIFHFQLKSKPRTRRNLKRWKIGIEEISNAKECRLLLLAKFLVLYRNFRRKWNKYCVLFVYITVNDDTSVATTIDSNEFTVDCDGENKHKCIDSASDETSSDSNAQSSYNTFTNTIKNSNMNRDSTELR